MKWRYRLRQFIMRLRPYVDPADRQAVCEVLPSPARALFEQMPMGDQVHALCVWRRVRQDAPGDIDLEQAALLHDVGKSKGRISLAHRVAIVLLNALNPSWLKRLASDDVRSWRYSFYVHLKHAELGAVACEQAGCPQQVVMLVRHHDAPEQAIGLLPYVNRLRVLRAADDRC
ncbi:MAG TPA: hypothetical protein GX702_15805 [Chloroflexi bacterium]|jgi:hypothetical protein|nr:hypothetical protein [Chloroflexota bacterium]